MVKGLTVSLIALAMIAGAFSGIVAPVAQAQSISLELGLTATKHTAEAGDKIGFTATIKNESSVRQTNLLVVMDVTENKDEVDYVHNSGSFKFSGGSGSWFDLDDDWGEGHKFSYIEPGETLTITWQMEVDDDTDSDEWIQVRFDAKSDQVAEVPRVFKNIDIDNEDQETHFTLSKSVNKEVANPGDVLTYTIKVKNDGDTMLEDIKILENLPNGATKWVTYVDDSGEYEIDGEEEDLKDDWADDDEGINLPHLNAGDTITITFKVKVRSDAPHGLILNNVVSVRPDGYDEWAQAAANTTVHVPGAPTTPKPPVKKPELPNTGIGGIFVAVWSLAASGLGSSAFYAGRKFILG